MKPRPRQRPMDPEEDARRQARSLGIMWEIVGHDADWYELQVWLDAIEQRLPPERLEELRPDWVHLHHYRGDWALVDSNVILSVSEDIPDADWFGTLDQGIYAIAYSSNMASPDGIPVLEYTDWIMDHDRDSEVDLYVVPLSHILHDVSDAGVLNMLIETAPEIGNQIIGMLQSGRTTERARSVYDLGQLLGWDLLDPEPRRVNPDDLSERWFIKYNVPRRYIEPIGGIYQ